MPYKVITTEYPTLLTLERTPAAATIRRSERDDASGDYRKDITIQCHQLTECARVIDNPIIIYLFLFFFFFPRRSSRPYRRYCHHHFSINTSQLKAAINRFDVKNYLAPAATNLHRPMPKAFSSHSFVSCVSAV